MSIDRAELYVQWSDVAGQEARLEQVLRAIPGVASLELIRPDGSALEARVGIAFDPGLTNPVPRGRFGPRGLHGSLGRRAPRGEALIRSGPAGAVEQRSTVERVA
jgi:hypothetical protein